MKTCRACGVSKSLDWFGLKRGKPRLDCKPCVNAYLKERTAAKRAMDETAYLEQRRAYTRDWHAKQPKERMQRRNWEYKLRAKFGMSPAEYDEILSRQGGVCAICRKANEIVDNRKWAVDHDHATGVVRGLLCSKCNLALGLLNDDVETMRAAAAYVEAHKAMPGLIRRPA